MVKDFLLIRNIDYLRRLEFRKYLISSSARVVFSRYVENLLVNGKKGIVIGAFMLKFFQLRAMVKNRWLSALKFLLALRRHRRSSYFLVTLRSAFSYSFLRNYCNVKVSYFTQSSDIRLYSRTAFYYSFFALVYKVFDSMTNSARFTLFTRAGRVVVFYKNYFFFRRLEIFGV